MATIASGALRPAYREFGQILRDLSNNEIAKKELLLATLPKGIMKYSQLTQNLRKDENTYGDVVSQLKQYVPQLVWKKRDGNEHHNRDAQGRGFWKCIYTG